MYMIKKTGIVLAFCMSACLTAVSQDLLQYVNPMMGTASTYEFSHGNTYPAVAVPWGMNFWSPQTGENRSGWLYSYQDKQIRGFRQTHQPSPWINDYGTFSIMPVSGELKVSHKDRTASFSHENEISRPDYYRVTFDNGTTTQLSATDRGAVFTVNFAPGQDKYIVIDAYDGGSMLSIDRENRRITGYARNNHGGVPGNFANYFVIEFDRDIVETGTTVNGEPNSNKNFAEHNHVCAFVRFALAPEDSLTIRTASSFIGPEQAQLNFDREVKDRTLAQVRDSATQYWNSMLGRVKAEGGTPAQLSTFYSCLYRVLLFPRGFYEYDRLNNPVYYSPYDGLVHPGYMYTDNGFWDTFRAVHPLLTLVYPEVSERVLQGLVATYEQSGFLPEWASPGHRACMIGNNSISLFTDAWMKGIRGFDSGKALEAMIHQTTAQGREASVGRNGFESYHELGYVPYPNYSESTAKTLEYAYSDWCLARFAAQLDSTRIADAYFQKAQNYKNLFDAERGFMRAKNDKGKWIEPFYPIEWGGPFTEGSSWHYTWSVMHDVEGLSRLMGSRERMAAKLDSMFIVPPDYRVGTYGFEIHEITEMVALNMGQYAHGNQPVQHAIYLYNYLGQPWKAQYHVRNVMDKLYNPGTKGYCGDEDNGQTSAWYVFSAMGFYPVCPGQPEYIIGSPLFKKITLTLPQSRTFVIEAPDNTQEAVYIKSARLNNKKLTHTYIKHDEIVQGGVLRFGMDIHPDRKRLLTESDYPYSYTIQKQ